jgi:hypothetical protein
MKDYNFNSWRDRLAFVLFGTTNNIRDTRDAGNANQLASIVGNIVANIQPGLTKEEVAKLIAEAIVNAIPCSESLPQRGLPEASSVTEAESGHVSVISSPSRKSRRTTRISLNDEPVTSDIICSKSSEPAQQEDETAKKPENMLVKLRRYLGLHYAFRYNVMTRESEMVVRDGDGYVVVGKREQNSIVLSAQSDGVNCWDKDVARIIESAETPTYHPFKEYFSNLPKWDGRDRVDELARRVSSTELWVGSFHRWMLAMSAQWMDLCGENARANCVAPLLISTEQGWGKSTFCRILMPPQLRRYYTERYELSKEGACEKKLASFGLINMDEFDSLPVKKMPMLKSLMQETSLNLTLKYQKNTTSLHRIASFIGTSNRRDLLTDNSGSRRFICVELEHEIDCNTPIDYPQLYAQLKEELQAGARTYFNKAEERAIQENNRQYYRVTPEEEAFHRHFTIVDRTTEGAEFLTASEIFARLKRTEPETMRGVSALRVSRLLPELGQRVHTKMANGYYVLPNLVE